MEDCSASCKFHGNAIISAVTRTRDVGEFERILTVICSNIKPWRLRDYSGKSILHAAASQGKLAIMEWYLEKYAFSDLPLDKRKFLINETDSESGWTALHFAVYHGEIAAAWLLLRHGADPSLRDFDGYSPVQLMMFDSPTVFQEVEKPPVCSCCIVGFFAWGSNSNHTLGFGDDQARTAPEKIRAPFRGKNCGTSTKSPKGTLELVCNNCDFDNWPDEPLELKQAVRTNLIARGEIHLHQGRCKHFHEAEKTGSIVYLRNPAKSLIPMASPVEVELYSAKLPIMDVVLRKFHTLFLTPDGAVYSCGHGQGGRLGTGSEKTALLPTKITFATNAAHEPTILEMSAGVNHSVFLSNEEHVYVCGTDEHGQLGLNGPSKVVSPTRIPLFGPVTGKMGIDKVSFDFREGRFGILADRYHTLVWTGRNFYAWGYNAGQLGPLRPEESPDSKLWKTPREVAAIRNFGVSPIFVRGTDAATIVCSKDMEIILVHDYLVHRLAKFPSLPRVQYKQYYELSELCIFGGTLHHPNGKTEKRDLVIVALAFGIPMIYIQNPEARSAKDKGFWRPISFSGIPRDLSEIRHISLSHDCLLVSSNAGECYSIKLSNAKLHPDPSVAPSYPAVKVHKLWGTLKVFSEPGSRNFACIQMVGRSHYELSTCRMQETGTVVQDLHESYFRFSGRPKKSYIALADEPEDDKPIDPYMLDELTGLPLGRLPFVGVGQDHYLAALIRHSEDKRKPPWDWLLRLRLQAIRTFLTDLFPQARGLWEVEPDFTFVCDDDGKEMMAHRGVLMKRVLYFQILLDGTRWKDTTKVSKPILPCDYQTARRMVEYIYNNCIEERLGQDECVKLMIVADFLVFDKLREYAALQLEAFLNHDQINSFYKLAQTYSSNMLNHLCILAMTRRIPDLIESHQMESLDRFTAEKLDWRYRELRHLQKALSYRNISPHELPGIDLSHLDAVTPRNFVPDDASASEPYSDSNQPRMIKRPRKSEQPKPDVAQVSPNKTQEQSGIKDKDGKSAKGGQSPVKLDAMSAKLANGSPNQISSAAKSESKAQTTAVKSPVKTKNGAPVSPVSMNATGAAASESPVRQCVGEPSTSSGPKLSWATKSNEKSPLSNPQSLSSIMAEEEKQEKKAPSVIKAGKLSGAVQQANIRRNQAAAAVSVPQSVPPPTEPSPQQPVRPKGNPWNVAPQAGASTVAPLGTIISNQSRPSQSKSTGTPIRPQSALLSGQKLGAVREVANGGVECLNGGGDGPKLSAVAFKQIQQDEAEQVEELKKSQRKPIGLIQIEEVAITQLMEFYGAQGNPEEYITVERVQRQQAAATWSARE